jgi:hypothetical protein
MAPKYTISPITATEQRMKQIVKNIFAILN